MILGLSLDENFVYVKIEGRDEVLSYPFSIAKNLLNNTWFIGEEAKNELVDNTDIVIDKLYYIMENDGMARIGEEEYKASELVKIFFSNLLSKFQSVEYVTVVVRECKIKILETIKEALDSFYKFSGKYKVTSYSEAFAAYLRYKGVDYYHNTVGLYNFTENSLTYYELLRYKGEDEKIYWKINTEKYLALPLDLLSGDAGKKVCDDLLVNFSKECSKESTYSHIILTGLGFEDSAGFREFMTRVCTLSEVETDINFFANAACIYSREILDVFIDKNIVLITDARTTGYIRLKAIVDQEERKIDLIEPGTEWFYVGDSSFDIIIDESEGRTIVFEILMVIEGVIYDREVVLPESIVLNKGKTNCFQIKLSFMQQRLLQISIIDKGFGEFFEPKNQSINLPVEL